MPHTETAEEQRYRYYIELHPDAPTPLMAYIWELGADGARELYPRVLRNKREIRWLARDTLESMLHRTKLTKEELDGFVSAYENERDCLDESYEEEE